MRRKVRGNALLCVTAKRLPVKKVGRVARCCAACAQVPRTAKAKARCCRVVLPALVPSATAAGCEAGWESVVRPALPSFALRLRTDFGLHKAGRAHTIVRGIPW